MLVYILLYCVYVNYDSNVIYIIVVVLYKYYILGSMIYNHRQQDGNKVNSNVVI